MTTPIPGRVNPRTAKTQKASRFCTSTTPIPQRVAQADQKPTRAEGRAGTARVAKNLEFLHLDHADPRRGSQTRSTIKVLPRRPRKPNKAYIGANAEAQCTWLCALGSMHLALCTWHHLALCTWLYALGSMHGSMHLAPCTWLFVFDFAQVTPCKLVRELRAEELFAMLSGKKGSANPSTKSLQNFPNSSRVWQETKRSLDEVLQTGSVQGTVSNDQ